MRKRTDSTSGFLPNRAINFSSNFHQRLCRSSLKFIFAKQVCFMEWTKDDFKISTDKSKIDVGYIHQFLSQSYWAENIPMDIVKRSVDGSLCFTVFQGATQIGFARVI